MEQYKVTLIIELTVESDLSEAEIEKNIENEIYVNLSDQDITGVQIESDHLESVEVWQEGVM